MTFDEHHENQTVTIVISKQNPCDNENIRASKSPAGGSTSDTDTDTDTGTGNDINKSGNDVNLDKGWAWVVLASAFIISAFLWGQVISFNVYFITLREQFGESRSKTAWIGSLNQATVNLVAISAGFFLGKFGPRGSAMLGGLIASCGYITSSFASSVDHLLVTYGLIVGLGYGLCFTACFAAIGQYFKRHLAIATSLSVTGGGLGIMFFGNLLEYFCDNFGWRSSMFIQGGLTLHICIFGATFFPKRSLINRKIMADDLLMTIRQRLVDPRVLILMALGFLGGVALMVVLVIYKDLANSRDLKDVFEATMTAVGAGNLIGRFTPGFILRLHHIHPLRYFVVTIGLCSVVLFSIAFTEHPVIFVCLAGILGCGQGNFVSAVPIIVAYMFGRREMAVTYGYVLFMTGIGLLIGGPFAGFIADYTGSYTGYLIICGCFLSLATILVIILYFIQERWTRK